MDVKRRSGVSFVIWLMGLTLPSELALAQTNLPEVEVKPPVEAPARPKVKPKTRPKSSVASQASPKVAPPPAAGAPSSGGAASTTASGSAAGGASGGRRCADHGHPGVAAGVRGNQLCWNSKSFLASVHGT